MNIKTLLPIAFVLAATSASAGGLSIDTVEQSMNSESWVATYTEAQAIKAQGPLTAFDSYVNEVKDFVETESLRHDYDGQS